MYEKELTNNDLNKNLKWIIENPNDAIYADTAEPARIEEIARAGFNIFPSDKSVKDGIDFCKRGKRYITKNSVNLIKEIEAYKHKEDKDGNVMEDPVKFNDHLMDARRYALYNHHKGVVEDTVDVFYLKDF